MRSPGKYLVGMAAGAALVAGGGLAFSAAGTAKYESCRMTQPARGVTQLCELDSASASAANARGGSTGVTGANVGIGIDTGSVTSGDGGLGLAGLALY